MTEWGRDVHLLDGTVHCSLEDYTGRFVLGQTPPPITSPALRTGDVFVYLLRDRDYLIHFLWIHVHRS